MGPQKLGSFPGSGPEVVKRQKIAKERATQRVGSWTVQNEMRGVLERVSACRFSCKQFVISKFLLVGVL